MQLSVNCNYKMYTIIVCTAWIHISSYSSSLPRFTGINAFVECIRKKTDKIMTKIKHTS